MARKWLTLPNVSLGSGVQQAAYGARVIGSGYSFSELPKPSAASVGNIYHVIDDFVTTDEFDAGAGIWHPADSTVKVIKQGDGYKYSVVNISNDHAITIKNTDSAGDGVVIKILQYEKEIEAKKAQITAPTLDATGKIVLSNPLATYMFPEELRQQNYVLEIINKVKKMRPPPRNSINIRREADYQQTVHFKSLAVTLAELSAEEPVTDETIHLMGGNAAN